MTSSSRARPHSSIDPSETLATAFRDDPGFRWILPDASRRVAGLRRLFAGATRHAHRHGGVATVQEGAAVGLWLPHDRAVIGLADAARGGMLSLPLRIGVGPMRRLSRMEHEGMAAVTAAVPTPFAYLMALAVAPDRQGAGLARSAVDLVASQARSAGHRTLALRTELAANVGLYQHLGFVLRSTSVTASSGLEVAVLDMELGA